MHRTWIEWSHIHHGKKKHQKLILQRIRSRSRSRSFLHYLRPSFFASHISLPSELQSMASLASFSISNFTSPSSSSSFVASNTPSSHLPFCFRPSHFKLLASPSSSFPHRSRIFAVPSDDEWGEEVAPSPVPAPSGGAAESLVATAEKPAEALEDGVSALKQALVDNLTGTDRGLKASSEIRAEIAELITQLEAKNPTPAPTDALPLLNGKWILAYTSFSELFPLLAAGTLPLLKVGEISQLIDSSALTVENSVSFTGPLTTTSFSTSASFEVRSPKRVQIKFEEGVIGTPQLTDSIEIPESIQFLGQKIDLTPFQGLLKSLESAATSVVKTISEQPPLKFPIRTDRAQSWLLTTYLDEDLRISRGDGGSIFILVKQGSSLLEDL